MKREPWPSLEFWERYWGWRFAMARHHGTIRALQEMIWANLGVKP